MIPLTSHATEELKESMAPTMPSMPSMNSSFFKHVSDELKEVSYSSDDTQEDKAKEEAEKSKEPRGGELCFQYLGHDHYNDMFRHSWLYLDTYDMLVVFFFASIEFCMILPFNLLHSHFTHNVIVGFFFFP